MTGENFKRVDRKSKVRELKERLWQVEHNMHETEKRIEDGEDSWDTYKYWEARHAYLEREIWYLEQLTR